MFHLLTLHTQGVLGWSPVHIGLAWVPFSFAMLAGVSLAGIGVRRVGLRWVLAAGFAVSAAGLAVFVAVAVTGLETGLEEGRPLASATAAGHSSAWLIATGLLVVGAVLSAVFIRPVRPARPTPHL